MHGVIEKLQNLSATTRWPVTDDKALKPAPVLTVADVAHRTGGIEGKHIPNDETEFL